MTYFYYNIHYYKSLLTLARFVWTNLKYLPTTIVRRTKIKISAKDLMKGVSFATN
jgi:hypothetical protein